MNCPEKTRCNIFELFKSGREIGYDIMGTMINAVICIWLWTYSMCLIRMNNSVRFVTIIKLHIRELCRFLLRVLVLYWQYCGIDYYNICYDENVYKEGEKIC